jgi:DNA-binding response OmpR family regulator
MSKILIVDEEKLIRWSLKEILSQDGHEVDSVASSADAVELALRFPYHLVIADFEIDGNSGYELLHKIKSLQPQTSIVILSAANTSRIQECLHDLDIEFIIEKPFDSSNIMAVAQRILDRRRP